MSIAARTVVAALALCVAGAVHAETDAEVGKCVGYLIMTKRQGGPEHALRFARNQRVALQEGRIFIERWKRYGPDLSGGDACRRLGLAPSSYPMAR